jgi:hypothetical protein
MHGQEPATPDEIPRRGVLIAPRCDRGSTRDPVHRSYRLLGRASSDPVAASGRKSRGVVWGPELWRYLGVGTDDRAARSLVFDPVSGEFVVRCGSLIFGPAHMAIFLHG